MKVYKYRSHQYLKEYLKDIGGNRAWFAKISSLNDPSEAKINKRGDFFDLSKEIAFLLEIGDKGSVGQSAINVSEQFAKLLCQIKHYGVYSTSKRWDDEIMWACYADSHKGICIEYDLEWLLTFHCQKTMYSVDVNYQEFVPVIDLLKCVMEQPQNIIWLLKKIIGVKSISWQHEDELRLLAEPHGSVEYDFRAITAIYFGCKAESELRLSVMETFKDRDIDYYLVEPERYSYTFKRTEVPDPFTSKNRYPYSVAPVEQHAILITEETRPYERLINKAVELVCQSQLCKQVDFAEVYFSKDTKKIPTVYIDFRDQLNEVRRWIISEELIDIHNQRSS